MSDEKAKNAILISASLICAVRLARQPIDNSPRTVAAIHDSIRLARMIYARMQGTPTESVNDSYRS
jgi:hypothetical protein